MNTDTAQIEQVIVTDLDEYQELSKKTALMPKAGHPIYYPAMGLAGEAGEVLNHVKKIMRDDADVLTEDRRAALKKELGDVLWYLAQVATALDCKLSDLASSNLTKLFDRKQRGVIQGQGDNR